METDSSAERSIQLLGTHVRLDPLGREHAPALAAAAATDPTLYRWSPVPQGIAAFLTYIDTALAWQAVGSAVPFAIVHVPGGQVVGSTRFWNLERWNWPIGHERHGRREPDVCEIGYTWLTASAMRSPINTEAKLLMLTHAFETWKVNRVCLHTDVRNQRSRAAIERLGARFEGVLRAHRLAVDGCPRDSARYSIVASEWSTVKQNLSGRLSHGPRTVE